jgi:hypothetical protein
MIGASINSVAELRRLKKILDTAIEESSEKTSKWWVERLAEGTPIDTRLAQRSWAVDRVTWNQYELINPVPYTPMLEFGLYEKVGRRTVRTARGIFSTQAREGIIYPWTKENSTISWRLEDYASRVFWQTVKRLGGI